MISWPLSVSRRARWRASATPSSMCRSALILTAQLQRRPVPHSGARSSSACATARMTAVIRLWAYRARARRHGAGACRPNEFRRAEWAWRASKIGAELRTDLAVHAVVYCPGAHDWTLACVYASRDCTAHRARRVPAGPSLRSPNNNNRPLREQLACVCLLPTAPPPDAHLIGKVSAGTRRFSRSFICPSTVGADSCGRREIR